jgi:hypothetical protein
MLVTGIVIGVIAGIILIVIAVVLHTNLVDDAYVAIPAVLGVLCLVAAIVLGVIKYTVEQNEDRDAIRIALLNSGYNVYAIDNGDDHVQNQNGWEAYVARKNNENCKGWIAIVFRDNKLTVVGDLAC